MLGTSPTVYGQEAKADLYLLLTEADSVQIASHEDLHYSQKVKPFKSWWHQLVENGKVNDTIIKERTNLDKVSVQELYKALTIVDGDPDFGAACFNPHHAIFIYKNGELVVLDICFECNGYSATSRITKILATFESYKAVADFFRKHKILYKLPPVGMYGY